MRAFLVKFLALPHHGLDLDDPATTAEHHARVIRDKKLLREFYNQVYSFFRKESRDLPEGIRLELGSGGGFIKTFLPDTVTSDIMPLPGVDQYVDALRLPYGDGTLAALYLFDVFHHIQNVGVFLGEAERCLAPGGKLILLEPSNTPVGRFLYRRLHHEPFDPRRKEWTLPEGGPMSMANGALPWMVFCRDRSLFERRFPDLPIQSIRHDFPLLYLLSGGVSFRPLAPGWAYPAIRCLEKILSPFSPLLGLSMKIVVRKIPPPKPA